MRLRMGREKKTTWLTIAWVCEEICTWWSSFQRKNNRIVLYWTAGTDHSHDTSADDVSGPSRRRELSIWCLLPWRKESSGCGEDAAPLLVHVAREWRSSYRMLLPSPPSSSASKSLHERKKGRNECEINVLNAGRNVWRELIVVH